MSSKLDFTMTPGPAYGSMTLHDLGRALLTQTYGDLLQ